MVVLESLHEDPAAGPPLKMKAVMWSAIRRVAEFGGFVPDKCSILTMPQAHALLQAVTGDNPITLSDRRTYRRLVNMLRTCRGLRVTYTGGT